MFKKIFNKELLKFLVVGVLNTLVGTTIMFGLYNLLHCGYWVSSALNYIITSIMSFFLNKYFTFKNKENSLKQVLKFIINIIICYVLAYGIAKPLVLNILSGQSTLIRDNVAMLTGMCLFTCFNFVGQKFFAFRDNSKAVKN